MAEWPGAVVDSDWPGEAQSEPAEQSQVAQPRVEAPPMATEALDAGRTIPAEPSPLTPRVGMSDLLGPTGYNMLASGLAMGALTPGPLPLKIAGGIAGAGAAYLGDEGTRRLQEQIGEIPGYIAGLGLSILSGGALGVKTAKTGRTPSHPTQFENVTIDSPETAPPSMSIPAQEGLFSSVPKDGGYVSKELFTDPGSKIMGDQFATGSGESLFGQGMVDLPQHVSPPMAEVPSMPGTFYKNLPPFQEKYPTLQQGPVTDLPKQEMVKLYRAEGIKDSGAIINKQKMFSEDLATAEKHAKDLPRSRVASIEIPKNELEQYRVSQTEFLLPKSLASEAITPRIQVNPKVGGIDMGSTGISGEYLPPKDYIEPPTPGRFAQAFNAEKQRWGQELPVLKTTPSSPVISSVEATHVYVEDYMESFVKQPWIKSLMKYGDNTKLAPLERKWIETHKAGGDPTANMPEDFKQMFQRMDSLLEEENVINRRRGIAEVPKNDGPYVPRMTDEDFHLMRTITRSQEGAKNAQSIGGFGQTRTMETLDEGIKKGITYKDWRQALLLREARGAVLRATDIMMTDLEKAGVLHRTKESAEAVSLTGKAYAAEGLPFSPKGGNWWVRSPEERQFLLQNMRQAGSGALNDIKGWAQQFLRNPSLVNPWPHIMKNMGLKQMQQAVASGLNPVNVFKQSIVYRYGKPDMLDEFKSVMPFTESGRTVWELIEKTGPKTMIQQLSRVPGMLNKYASKKIFAEWDPAMRYGLWREYVRQGKTPQEAANHTWIDLIRYGTRAERIDAWNSLPFNFFVPWRVGTLRTMNKALQSSPVRFGLFMGAVDTIREMDYRYNGRWTHLPYDYIERPLMTLIQDGKSEALQTAAATIIAGPGGEYMFRSIQNIINDLQGKGGVGDLRTLAWGIAQVYDLWPQYEAFQKDHNPAHLTDMLGLVLLGRHATPYGGPRRLGELIPEGLIRKHPQVREAEALRESFKEHSDVKHQTKLQRDIEKYKKPWKVLD